MERVDDYTMRHKHKIGYACMNMDIQPNDYKTVRKSNISDERLREVIAHNLNVLKESILYNIENDNHMFRISSSLIPFASSDLMSIHWQDEFKSEFIEIRNLIADNNIRISMHPGQYTIINSDKEDVVARSILELVYHAEVLSLLSASNSTRMILHVGGVYGDKQAAIARFIDVYNQRLSKEVKQYLVIENDDRLFSVADVLHISSKCGVPVVFDNLHHKINPSLSELSLSKIVTEVANTWKSTDTRMKMHYSQQATDKRVGAHSDTIYLDQFIEDFNDIYDVVDCDIMLEVKDKNRSFLKVDLLLHHSMKRLEIEWAKYKYWVMARSHNAYNTIRAMFKDNQEVDVQTFYGIIDRLRNNEIDIKNEKNAFYHVWGYFKNLASDKEKDKFLNFLESDTLNKDSIKQLYRYIWKLTNKYEVEYLQQSYFFDGYI